MANYGELIDNQIQPESFTPLSSFYSFFNDYFGNPILGLKNITPEGHTIYAAKIKSNFLKQKRYLFAILPSDPRQKTLNRPKQLHLSDIAWSCLQTRLLDEDIYTLPTFSYNHEKPRNSLFHSIIKITNKEPTKYTYSCDLFPSSRIVLLIPENQMKPYNDAGTVSLALETFQCLVYK
jgi:hypothetical protein